MSMKSVLIAGAGIAGPTLAYWLKAAGFEPAIVERAPALRSSGYVIDFWGLGYDLAEHMGLIGEINRVGYHARELRIINDAGYRIAGFGTSVFSELTGGRYVTLPRSALSGLLFGKVKDSIETIFDDEIVALEEQTDCVRVVLKHVGERRFDLLSARTAYIHRCATLPSGRSLDSRNTWATPSRHSRPLAIAPGMRTSI